MIDPNQFIEAHYSEIESAVRLFCKKRKIDEWEDTLNELTLKLLENEGAVLKSFRQTCQVKTFIFTLLSNAHYDQIRKDKGRWTVSKVAQEQGKLAEALDRLIAEEHKPLDEAFEILVTNQGYAKLSQESLDGLQKERLPATLLKKLEPFLTEDYQSLQHWTTILKSNLGKIDRFRYQKQIIQHLVPPPWNELKALANLLPNRIPKGIQEQSLEGSEQQISDKTALGQEPEKNNEAQELDGFFALIDQALETFSPDERFVFVMNYQQNLPLSLIQKTLKGDVYKLRQKIHTKIKSHLNAAGISLDRVQILFQNWSDQQVGGNKTVQSKGVTEKKRQIQALMPMLQKQLNDPDLSLEEAKQISQEAFDQLNKT